MLAVRATVGAWSRQHSASQRLAKITAERCPTTTMRIPVAACISTSTASERILEQRVIRSKSDNNKGRQYHTTAVNFKSSKQGDNNTNTTTKKSTAHKLKRSPKVINNVNKADAVANTEKANTISTTGSTVTSEATPSGTTPHHEPVADASPSTEPNASSSQASNDDTRTTRINHGHYHIQEFAPRIVVVGVGGAGSNAICHMMAQNVLQGVEFVAINTDAQHLATLSDTKAITLQIGQDLTGGLGCGANPDAGRLAAQESQEMIAEVVATDDTHMVFVTAGMGGVSCGRFSDHLHYRKQSALCSTYLPCLSNLIIHALTE
jgi:hypothetical protein